MFIQFLAALSLVVNVGSYHVDTDLNYNESNPGLGIEYTDNNRPQLTYMAGNYYNSLYHPTVYAGIRYNFNSYVGATAVVASGYDFRVPIIVGLTFSAPVSNNMSIAVSVTPPVPDYPAVLMLQIRKDF